MATPIDKGAFRAVKGNTDNGVTVPKPVCRLFASVRCLEAVTADCVTVVKPVYQLFAKLLTGREGGNFPPHKDPSASAASDPSDKPGLSSLAHLYSVMADILRDQIAAQLESASTNNLESVGVIAAALAFVVALLVVRATHGNDPSWWWWWYPLPGFMIPTVIVGTPLLPPTKKRRFKDGPDIPRLLEGFAA
ncbi:MAG: hypothetical protein M0008_04585, partial [Actinomycetota bacterium]|nr:hypothetical protein [Actinomycetota bacterium]